ncbi:MAG TPA: hypothetical protein VFV67_09820 [Actinophytocola sp.]|uniref:hypothetical protein n=1 Tax=Actinophytocola sp. TaxID=1872138 RepID=UPI002DBF6D76|nr:hypothetical protein [Actinophytocola sp.]HEU5470937.1 hypothetical protein [Actinophytocola sp.]
MSRTGAVTARGADSWWAWAASRIVPAAASPGGDSGAPQPVPATTVHNEHSGSADNVVQAGQIFGGVHFHGDRRPVPDDSPWLRSCWAPLAAAGAAMEMRYLTRPGDARLGAFLIVRAEAHNEETAERQVVALRSQLGTMPGHVIATPVTDEAETHAILEPFRPHTNGIAEIRKRLTTHRTDRDDAPHPWLATVTPLTYQHQPWTALWSELAGLPFHTALSVGLVPYPIGPGLRSRLAAMAADLARLAQPGPSPTAVWTVPRPPDAFAAAALPLISDAVRRYTDRAFVIRISVAAERPLPGILPELVASTISPATGTHAFVAAAPVVVRPEPADKPIAWHNFTALNFAPLSAYDQGNPPEAVGELERALSAVVDLDEAAAAFRLPHRGSGPALFAAPNAPV